MAHDGWRGHPGIVSMAACTGSVLRTKAFEDATRHIALEGTAIRRGPEWRRPSTRPRMARGVPQVIALRHDAHLLVIYAESERQMRPHGISFKHARRMGYGRAVGRNLSPLDGFAR
jgi:hypothetical protein